MGGTHILITDFEGNPNIGAYALATDKYCLVGHNISKNIIKEIEEIFKVPVYQISIAGTDLVGIFCAANNRKLLVPNLVFDSEIKRLKDLNIDFEIIDTELTALGNNILCNDNGAIINIHYTEKEKEKIEKALGVKAIKMKISNVEVPGSCAALTNTHCVIHRDIDEEDLKKVEKHLGVKCETGTVNLGVPYIRVAVVNNSFGLMVSKSTTGPEINNLDQGLGYR